MPAGKWTEEEVEFLIESYKSLDWSTAMIADFLERSVHSVVRKASILGIKKVTCSSVEVPEGYKLCRTCKQVIPFDKFYKNFGGKSRDGFDSSCKACVSEREKKRRFEKKIKELEKRVESEDKKPKEDFIKANKDMLFTCTKCNRKLNIEQYSVFMRGDKVRRNTKCKECSSTATKKRDLARLREQGYI